MSITFEAFQTAAREQGCTEVLERHWGPDTVLESHSHSFGARALVVQGEMWLTVGGATRHLHPGDRFELDAHLLHSERYGPEGATYWVARSEQAK
ncbi:MAG: AraC family transcriptional regulator [Burkholderiaceae bacterium]